MPNFQALLKEIAKAPGDGVNSGADLVRRNYLAKLHHLTERNIIAYYSGFLSKPKIEGVEINDDDKNGFMACIHKLDKAKGLDLILHTPGGDGAATESLIFYLHEMFGHDIRAIVPQTVHHCYMITLSNSPAFKIIENHLGRALVKQQQMMVQQPPQFALNIPPEIQAQLVKEIEEEKAKKAQASENGQPNAS